MSGPGEAVASDRFAAVAGEVTRYFDAKGLTPSWHWQDLAPQEHAYAFTVAKTAGYDVLDDLRKALSRAIAERMDLGQFVASIEPTLKAKGWWGRVKGVDPTTGEIKDAMLGTPGRLRTIWNANVDTAYAAGEWEKIWRTRDALPYLEYRHTTSAHPRPEHLAWVGTLLPVDDPWWDAHYPPNGWNCKCRVSQQSDWSARNAGYDPDSPKRPPDFGTRRVLNTRSGAVETVPVGIDPGWQTNPGKTRGKTLSDMLAGRLDAMPEAARRAATVDLVGSRAFKDLASGAFPYARMTPSADMAAVRAPANAEVGAYSLPVATLAQDVRASLGATARVVRLSVADAAKQVAKRPEVTPAIYAVVQRLMDEGSAVAIDPARVALFGVADGKLWWAVLQRAASALDEVYLKSLRRATAAKIAAQARRAGTTPIR